MAIQRYILLVTFLVGCLFLPAPAALPGAADAFAATELRPKLVQFSGPMQGQAATTTLLKAAPSPSIISDTVSLEATVLDSLDGLVPSGTIRFYDSGTLIGEEFVGMENWTRIILPSLPVGNHVFTATYEGNSTFAPSQSAPLTHTVRRSGVRLYAGPLDGFQARFDFEVVPEPGMPIPEGTVTVSDGLSFCTAAVSERFCTITFPSVGLHVLTAVYSGTATLESNSSAPVEYVVTRYHVEMQGTFTPPVVDAGQPITLSVILRPRLLNIPQWPTGVITVSLDGINPLCDMSGGKPCTFTLGGGGPIRIDYSGDALYEPNSISLMVPVRAATTITIDAQPNPIRAGDVITLSAGISGYHIRPPTGEVFYYDNGVYAGKTFVHPRIGYVFPMTTTLTVPGRHSITGVYSGDTLYSSSSSPPLTVEVLPRLTYLPLVVSEAPAPDE